MPHRLHVHATPEGARTAATMRQPMGPGIDEPDILDHIVRLETWASSFKDPGPDWCEFRCYNNQGELFHTVRVDGY
jgi:hypothetical protein